jgi:hypothetical protein
VLILTVAQALTLLVVPAVASAVAMVVTHHLLSRWAHRVAPAVGSSHGRMALLPPPPVQLRRRSPVSTPFELTDALDSQPLSCARRTTLPSVLGGATDN